MNLQRPVEHCGSVFVIAENTFVFLAKVSLLEITKLVETDCCIPIPLPQHLKRYRYGI